MKTETYKNKFILLIAAAIFYLFATVSCDDTLVTNDIDTRYIPETNISFSEHLLPVFQFKCAASGCHNTEDHAAGIDMLDWNSFTIEPYVLRGNPDASTLVLMVEGRIQPTMPPLGTNVPLTEDQIRGLRTWISEGAQNN